MSPAKRLATLFILILVIATAAPLASADPSEHVPTVRTPLSRMELLHALREGHLKVFGKYPSDRRLAMAWGQVAFENGGGKWSFNHNLGNVGASAQGQLIYFNRGDKHWYRAFFDFEDGAAAYWEVIKRCQPALASFEWGNPHETAIRLKRCNYFEASLDEYAPGFSRCYSEAITKLIPEDQLEQRQREEELLAAIRRSIEADGTTTTPAPDASWVPVADRDGD
jgi:hypothetical protein